MSIVKRVFDHDIRYNNSSRVFLFFETFKYKKYDFLMVLNILST